MGMFQAQSQAIHSDLLLRTDSLNCLTPPLAYRYHCSTVQVLLSPQDLMACIRVRVLGLFEGKFKVRAFHFPQRAIQEGILSSIPQKACIACLRPMLTFKL